MTNAKDGAYVPFVENTSLPLGKNAIIISQRTQSQVRVHVQCRRILSYLSLSLAGKTVEPWERTWTFKLLMGIK